MRSAVKTWRPGKKEKIWVEALILTCSVWLFLGACGPRSGSYPEGTLGTPEHCVFNGFALLKMGRTEDAQREFAQALRLDPKCSGAYRGMGWVAGRKGNFPAAFASMDQARETAVQNEEKALVEVGFMGLYTMQKRPDWIERVEKSFTKARALEENLPEAYFQLGLAYKQAYRFSDAEKAFGRVIDINRSLVPEAKEELESLREVRSPGPGSPRARQ